LYEIVRILGRTPNDGEKIKTVADLLAQFGQMQKEGPDFEQQYTMLPPGLDPERPYGEMLAVRYPDEQ